MRIILLIGVILILGSSTYLGYSLMQDLNERVAERQANRNMMRATIIRVLKNHPVYSFHQVVIGPGEEEDELAFRARVTRTGSTQSAYGVVSSRCPEEVSEANSALEVEADARPARDATCWEMATLYIDGVPVEELELEKTPASSAETDIPADVSTDIPTDTANPTSGATGSGAAGSVINDGAGTDGEAAVTAISPDIPLAPSAAPQPPIPQPTTPESTTPESPAVAIAPTEGAPAPDVPAPATSEPSLRPSHAVRLSTVNARAAPNGSIEARLSQGTPLLMLERSGGWGFFLVLDGPEADRQVWVAFSVLESI